MKPFIFGKRNLIHIIDIRETIKGLVRAANFLTQLTSQGKDVVFIGTKRQAKSLIQKEAQRCGMHFVSERWLGGTLTNYHTIRSRLKRLEELEGLEKTGEIESYSKKRISSLRRERRKITRNLDGIRNMKQLPGTLVVVDIRREYISVKEAKKMGIPVIGLVDTDCDPREVDIVIPGNDDAYRAVQQVLRVLTDAVIAGRDKYVQVQAEIDRARQEEATRAAEAEAVRRASEAELARKAAEARAKAQAEAKAAAASGPAATSEGSKGS
jgi:small subunit ribosomal protein S2